MKICAFFEMKTFFLVFTPDFVEFRNEELCFLVHTLRLEVLKFLCPSQNLFMPPQSRYLGAGPDLQIAKTVFRDISQNASIMSDK